MVDEHTDTFKIAETLKKVAIGEPINIHTGF